MVSVIIPVYNAERTLLSCVQSVFSQTYADLELILIDDGSDDRSGSICDEIGEKCRSQGVQCQVIHQKNGGVSKARNCGMEHANGEYFVCVDSDDIVEPSYLEDLVRTAEERLELGHVLCGFRCTSHVHDYIFTDQELVTVLDRADYMLLFEKILVQGPCLALYRTEIVRKHNIRMREDLSLAEDILFNLAYLDALDRTAIGIVNKPNYIYQDENPNSLYRKYRQNLLDINEAVHQSLVHYLRKWNISDEASWQIFYDTAFYNYRTIFKNTFHKLNPMSSKEKIAYNSEIMKQQSFQVILQKYAPHIPPALRKAYESGDYRKVLALERIQTVKRFITGILR